jgi:Lon protease-like protein
MVPLHIFEARYREMLSRIMEGNHRFGILFHDPDESGPFMNEPGSVGTVARVARHQPLPDGRSLILVRGLHRFRIEEEVRAGAPYYEARVSPLLDLPPRDPLALVDRRRRSLALLETLLKKLPHVPNPLPSFDVDSEISFRLAAVVRMDAGWKQELLEMRDEVARLDRLDPVLRVGVDRWWEEGGSEA